MATQRIECAVELEQAFADELDAPVAAAGQQRQDLGIENEQTVDPSVVAKGVMKRGMVVAAQIATKPHQRGIRAAQDE